MDIPEELIQAKAQVEFGLLALPGVVGIGLGAREENGEFSDELAVRILVEDASRVPDGLPSEIAGVAVCIIERVYEPVAFPDVDRYPELRGGIRIESQARGFGTMGALVMDTATGEILGLSNFHVTGPVGTQIWQSKTPNLIASVPPILDDLVGDVLRVDFPDTPPLPLSPIRVSTTDSGVFRTNGAAAQGRGVSRAISGQGLGFPDLIPAVTATAEPAIFQTVRKRGFMTGPTNGSILGAQVVGKWMTINWSPGGGNTYLVEQVEIFGNGGVFVDGGDSGSLVLDGVGSTALGLLYGASRGGAFAPAGHFGMMSLIANVEARLGVSTVWA
ncbi:hypothetical protein [Dyella tabacisoli]|uniref:Serine protease n=1 Tax=Dyella tabacisoli TaxID=2282381 RepID=A0A369US39_9GAMM|nr:hypothetical protein [Dyella tabacisoli]RDD83572.1 hypothetical protein DVJ77_03065 [Dyella tabacisoli]